MTPEERARACATRIESKLTGPDPRGGSEEDLLGLAVHCFETAVAEIKAEIRAAVEEEREALIPAIEEAALTLTEYHIKLPEQLTRALEDRDG